MDNLRFQDFDRDNVNLANNEYGAPGQIGDQAPANGQGLDPLSVSSSKNFFSFDFYQQYFDVDAEQVFSRILNSMVPRFNSNFITDHIQPFPDLYGPFWISVTLIFTTAICGNLARYIETSGDVITQQYGSDFRLVTGASTIIFCYVVLVPSALFSIFWYRKSEMQYSYLDLLCAYGYSLSIFVPVSIFWVLQMQWFRWMLILVSVMVSSWVLIGSIWPAVKNDRSRVFALSVVVGIVFFHAMLAVGFKEYYFDASHLTRSEDATRSRLAKIEHADLPLAVSHAEKPSDQLAVSKERAGLQADNQLKGSMNLSESLPVKNAKLVIPSAGNVSINLPVKSQPLVTNR